MRFSLRAIIFLCVTIHFSTLTYAQVNFVNAFVVTHNGDTLQGSIDYKAWDRNPTSITFKVHNSEDTQQYEATDIASFSVENDVYVSKTVAIDISPENVNDMSYDTKANMHTQTSFLRLAISGDKNLYYLIDKEFKQHFLLEAGDTTLALLNTKSLQDTRKGDVLMSSEKYKQQLNYFFRNCESIEKDLESLKYTLKALKAFVQTYNNCATPAPVIYVPDDGVTFQVEALAGISFSSLTLTYFPVLPYNISDNFTQNSPPFFSGGLGFNIILPRNLNSWAVTNELQFKGYNNNATFIDSLNENRYKRYEYMLHIRNLQLVTTVKYEYPGKSIQPFVKLGISNGFTMLTTNTLRTEEKFYNDLRLEENPIFVSHRKHEQGLIVGAGLKYKILLFEGRYQLSNAFSPFVDLKSSSQSMFLLIGCELFNSKKKY